MKTDLVMLDFVPKADPQVNTPWVYRQRKDRMAWISSPEIKRTFR